MPTKVGEGEVVVTLAMPEELEVVLKAELVQEEGKDFMPYVTSWERIAEKKGREEGREEAGKENVLTVLCSRFGAVPDEVKALVLAVEAAAIQDAVREAATVASLEQFVERLRARA